MASDEALLAAWRAGDREAGNDLLRRHFRAVYRFLSTKLADGADDLVQRTFVACMRAQQQFRGEGSFRGWLLAIARNELIAHLRGLPRAAAIDPGVSAIADLVPAPSSVVAQHRAQKLLLAALRGIPLDLQIALELHYWEQLSTAELSQVLAIPQGTVKSRLRRAREALEARMVELADHPELVKSTMDDLERWAKSVGDELAARVPAKRMRAGLAD